MKARYGALNLFRCFICLPLLFVLVACQNDQPTQPSGEISSVPDAMATPTPFSTAISMSISGHRPAKTPTATATPTKQPVVKSTRPVLAFYYMWYNIDTWNRATMSDLPTIKYNSSDDATIDRQVNWAANAGITGFISSWWGPGDQTDTNFGKLLAHAATLEKTTHDHFASTIYFECNAPKLSGTTNMINTLKYFVGHYGNNPYLFYWQGKPVIFFWDPLGNGRTLAQWASIRNQVDPNRQMIWSAEGVDMKLLDVFDGIHLFSGGYWGILNNNMTAVDQGFRTKVDAYNRANGTHKIWAAGVIPGYDDTRVPGRKGTYIVPRNNGATYNISWTAALASRPDWITITSFNEWFEGAVIEPGLAYGTQYLALTRQFV